MGDTDERDLVPMGHHFDVVWRGYDRQQVTEYVDSEIRALAADRDSATTMVSNLVRLLDETRAEMWRLRERYDRLCRAPLSPAALSERLQRLNDIAQAEASDIVVRARARAEHIRLTAEESMAGEEATAAHRRRQVEEDFRLAMAHRRAELMNRIHEYEATRRAEAERLVLTAHRTAADQVASANSEVEALHAVQRRLSHRLRTVRGLFLRTCALVDPLDSGLVSLNGTEDDDE